MLFICFRLFSVKLNFALIRFNPCTSGKEMPPMSKTKRMLQGNIDLGYDFNLLIIISVSCSCFVALRTKVYHRGKTCGNCYVINILKPPHSSRAVDLIVFKKKPIGYQKPTVVVRRQTDRQTFFSVNKSFRRTPDTNEGPDK